MLNFSRNDQEMSTYKIRQEEEKYRKKDSKPLHNITTHNYIIAR